MKFSEYIVLSESMKDLSHVIGHDDAKELTSTKPHDSVSVVHDKVFGKNNHHIEVPVKAEMPESVTNHITGQGDTLHDDGEHVVLPSGRHASIPKYLAKSNAPKQVQDDYQNFSRHKAGDTKLVISRKPAEVASASCGTSWKSCAAPNDGIAWNHMPHELKHGSLIALHVNKNAKPNEDGEYDSKDVHGRVLLKRHDSEEGHMIFHPEDKSYGKFGANAKAAVQDFANKHYPMKDVVYNKHEDVYNDDDNDTKINDNISKEKIHHILDTTDNHVVKEKILRSSKHIDDDTADKIYNEGNPYTSKSVMKNPHLSGEKLHDLIIKSSPKVASAAFENPSIRTDHIDSLYKNHGDYLEHSIATHPKTSTQTLQSIISTAKAGRNIHDAAANKNLSNSAREAIINKGSVMAKKGLAWNKSLSSKHIDKLLDDPDEDIHHALAYHLNASSDNIHKMLSKGYTTASRTLGERKDITPEHITTALNHPDSTIRAQALNHHSVNKEHVIEALKDENPIVREQAELHKHRFNIKDGDIK